MAPSLPSLDVRRLRSYVFRLPLFTRVILTFVAFFWILELQQIWNVVQWGALIPKEINFGTSSIPTLSSIAASSTRSSTHLHWYRFLKGLRQTTDQHISDPDLDYTACYPPLHNRPHPRHLLSRSPV
ncbi:MAG: hypothetical protein Q9207_000303 [Kuettlingeria erythrocarpa]